MSRDATVTTEYKAMGWLPWIIATMLLIVVGIFLYFSNGILEQEQAQQANNQQQNPPDLTGNATATPKALPTFPTPSPYPTITEEQLGDIITQLEGLNPPPEALDELKGIEGGEEIINTLQNNN